LKPEAASSAAAPASMSKARKPSLFDPEITIPAIFESFKKLTRPYGEKPGHVRDQVGAAVTTVELFFAHAQGESFAFVLQIALWLWFTVIFANFAEAMAEGRGKAQAMRCARAAPNRLPTAAFRRRHRNRACRDVAQGHIFVVSANELIPPTARSSKARRPSMNRRSRANQPGSRERRTLIGDRRLSVGHAKRFASRAIRG